MSAIGESPRVSARYSGEMRQWPVIPESQAVVPQEGQACGDPVVGVVGRFPGAVSGEDFRDGLAVAVLVLDDLGDPCGDV